MRPNTISRRAAFTLVELMVAMAVIILIMAILSRAFVVSADTFRQLKAVGDMTDQLRAANIVIRRDLTADHFLEQDDTRTPKRHGLKVSDQRLDLLTLVGTQLSEWEPPTGGFFRAKCGPADFTNVIDEGIDNDGLRSYRATNHYLHFTSVLPGGKDGDAYTATVGGTPATSRAAEIALFLAPSGSTGSIPTYNLIRRERLVAMYAIEADSLQQATRNNPADAAAVISMSGTTVNTMADLTDPRRRLGGNGTVLNAAPLAGGGNNNLSPSSTRTGDDILLSNVLSFEVKLIWKPATLAAGYNRKAFGANPVTEDTDSPFNFIPIQNTPTISGPWPNPQVQHMFDTWSNSLTGWDNTAPTTLNPNPALPQRIRVQAVRIVVRVWDQKLKLSRQMTIVQDL